MYISNEELRSELQAAPHLKLGNAFMDLASSFPVHSLGYFYWLEIAREEFVMFGECIKNNLPS